MRALASASAVLLALRLYASSRVGFGDSEALYAAYAAHPQPAYLDHPGLVGLAMRAIGGGAVPLPARVHVVTTVAATLVPWLVLWVARALGAQRDRAVVAALATLAAPEIAVGLFALTPDLLLAPLWLGALGLAGVGLAAKPAEARGAAALVAAGLLAGIAASAKISGVLLWLSLAVTYVVARPRAELARTPWPWAGLLAGAIVFWPVVAFEARTGWPMLQHRLVDTQHGAGVALRNVGALVGGQLAYVSPVLAWVAIRAARDLTRARRDDVTSTLLFVAFAVPLVPLVLLSIWSRVAEPHWVAPALLALPLHAARRGDDGAVIAPRRLVTAAIALGGALTLAAHAWVLVPTSAALLPAGVDPRLDIASELYGWPRAVAAITEQRRAYATPLDPEGSEVVVVGPHWTVCAQIQAALPDARVGCATPIKDDFDGWLPRPTWRAAEHVLFVTDNRFGDDGASLLPEHVAVGRERVSVLRGGRVARVFEIHAYDRRARAGRDGASPANGARDALEALGAQ